jgi:hypothetical protein
MKMGKLEIREHDGEKTIDEVVAHNIDLFHIEQMDARRYWFAMSIGDKEWHFCLCSRSTITLSCNEKPE